MFRDFNYFITISIMIIIYIVIILFFVYYIFNLYHKSSLYHRLFNKKIFKQGKKSSKFTAIIHLNTNLYDKELSIKKLFHMNTTIIKSNYSSDIVFLGYIINHWNNMPHYLIFLRDLDWTSKKSIVAYINKVNLIWGNMKYMNLDHYIQYVMENNKGELLGESDGINNTINKHIVKQFSDIYVPFNYNILQDEEFRIFWNIYMLPYFGELNKSIPKIMNINKQKTTGQFMVNYKQIYYYPVNFYTSLLKYIRDNGNNYLPILWDVILS